LISIPSAHGFAMFNIAGTAHAALTDVKNHVGCAIVGIDAICTDQSDSFEQKAQVPPIKQYVVYVHSGASTDIDDLKAKGVNLLLSRPWVQIAWT
jgi:hypothetical protein